MKKPSEATKPVSSVLDLMDRFDLVLEELQNLFEAGVTTAFDLGVASNKKATEKANKARGKTNGQRVRM